MKNYLLYAEEETPMMKFLWNRVLSVAATRVCSLIDFFSCTSGGQLHDFMHTRPFRISTTRITTV